MEIGRSHPSIRDFSGFEFPIFPSDFISKKNPIIEINNRLDKLQIPWGLNEKTVESILRDLEETDVVNQPEYWLLMSRLIESTLICAGHYADHCEFSAAGDLLFNPRKILIHCREHDEPILKNRHGRICDQMNAKGAPHRAFIDWFRSHAEIQIVTPPLLPYLLEHVERSGYISTSYLESVRKRSRQVTITIGFLCAWSLDTMEALYHRIQRASPETRKMITDHLCLFDKHLFDRIGWEIEMISKNPSYLSEFLVERTV
jgi:hypothetical protein